MKFYQAKKFLFGFLITTMKVSFSKTQPQFCSNTRYYVSKDKIAMATYTRLFRADLDWKGIADYLIKHFREKKNVQLLQFGASDGSEAYSLIISLLKKGREADKFFPINAYDIDKEIFEASRSGLLNLNVNDISKLEKADCKYFEKSSQKLDIKGDTLTDRCLQINPSDTYKVSKMLTEKVNFHNGDMFDILQNHEDKSNTVLFCRNTIFLLPEPQIDRFTTLAENKLKNESMIVTGECDSKVNRILERKGFVRLFENVYKKV